MIKVKVHRTETLGTPIYYELTLANGTTVLMNKQQYKLWLEGYRAAL